MLDPTTEHGGPKAKFGGGTGPTLTSASGLKSTAGQAGKEYKDFDRKITKPKPPKRGSDFGEEYEGREADILLHDGTNKRGKILEVRPYFIKLQPNDGSEVLYINKAYVVLIKVMGV